MNVRATHAPTLKWELAKSDSTVVASLQGSVDENTNFTALASELKGISALRFDLSGVSRINSCGVRDWVNFIRTFPSTVRLELDKCSPVVVTQVNLISNFAGNAKILSVNAPFVCEACGHERELTVDVREGRRPTFEVGACPSCKKMEWIFDDVEESYFSFLR